MGAVGWLVLSGAAWAGTPVAWWEMLIPQPGTIYSGGLVAGQFDDDDVLDYAAVLLLDKNTAGVVLSYFDDSKDPFIEFSDVLSFRATRWDLNQDGTSALVLFEPTSENAGEIILTDVTKGVFSTPLFLQGTITDGLFAYDHDLADVDGDGILDILVGAPGLDRVYVASGTLTGYPDLATLPGYWQGPAQADLVGFGAGVAVRSRGGVEEVVIARCTVENGACSNAALATRPVTEGIGGVMVDNTMLQPAPDVPLLGLEVVPDIDGDGVDELLWLGRTQKILLSSQAGDAASGTIIADGDDVVINQGARGPQLWVQDGGIVYVISRLGEDGTAADLADDQFALKGAPLGIAITDAGDLTGDGCEDILASTEESVTVYLLASPCSSDTGLTGDDTGDDTGPTGDDTGPTGGMDSAVPCIPGLGWTCGGRSSLATLLLLGLLGALHRTASSRPAQQHPPPR